LDDYSITHPSIFLEKRAHSLGLTIDHFHVPPINMICQKLQAPALLPALNATPLPGFPDRHVGHLNNTPVGVILMNGFGAPYLASLVEQLIVCGARIIIFCGAMGAFQHRLQIGDFVIPTHAIIGEGTSHYYPSHDAPPRPDSHLITLLDTACRKIGVIPHHGSIWSTDAIYREMRSQVEHLQHQGVLGVDMETSALFTIARHHQIKAVCLHRISDSMATLQWQHHFHSQPYLHASKELSPKILLEFIPLLAE
jgi:uridine phosphorylase